MDNKLFSLLALEVVGGEFNTTKFFIVYNVENLCIIGNNGVENLT